MKELLLYMAKNLVDNPEAVKVTEQLDGDVTVLELSVAPEDMGKVIGRQGRIAKEEEYDEDSQRDERRVKRVKLVAAMLERKEDRYGAGNINDGEHDKESSDNFFKVYCKHYDLDLKV